jgi:hypothetical protein
MGLTAFAASALSGPSAGRKWLTTWLGAAFVAGAIGLVAMARKARASGSPLFGAPLRRFALAYLPPLAAGAVLTAVFVESGFTARLPGCWLLLYGTAAAAGGALSVRVVPIMGILFMALGTAAFTAPAGLGNAFMATGFGGLHLCFGLIIARKYGG